MNTPGEQLMDFIDEEILIFGRHADWKGHYRDWSSSAEAKINEVMDKILTKAVREEVCNQLLAVVKNIQELPEP